MSPRRKKTAPRPGHTIETRIVRGIEPDPRTRRQVAAGFRALLADGTKLRPSGEARHDPAALSAPIYTPRQQLRLFDASFFLTDPMFDDALGFFVAYIGLHDRRGRIASVHPRILYKDSSLVWRAASHFVHSEEEYWIGKGEARWISASDGDYLTSAEETTNLPYEIQGALDVMQRKRRPRRNDDAIRLVLREGPPDRVEPYADFTAPRRRAAAVYRINGGRRIARFTRRHDPTSLRFVRGFEPDFTDGVVEEVRAGSKFFGGDLRKFRIVSTNRLVQFLFISSPTHAWVNPPQALTTELSTYGVRTVDVLVDDDMCVPAYEYHFLDDGVDPPRLHSQIPEGFAGAPNPLDPSRSDASAWVEALPVIREFRAKVLRRRARKSASR